MRDIMLILHFIGLGMGLGTGFAHAFLGSAAAKMNPTDGTKFKLNTLVLSTMGHIGIGLLLISGFYLITPYWKNLTDYPFLIGKLILVAALITLITLINIAAKKAKNGDAEAQLKKIEMMGKLTLPIAILIVIFAAVTFH